MARSSHARYDAATKHERAAARKPRPTERRVSNRRQVIAAALAEV